MMTKDEIIEQLESLLANSEDFQRDPNHDETWDKDVECLNIVIDFIKKNYKETNTKKIIRRIKRWRKIN